MIDLTLILSERIRMVLKKWLLNMNEYTLHDLNRGSKLYEGIRRSVSMDRFVPVIGSGFTKGIQAERGRVPDSNEFRKRLVDILVQRKLVDATDEEAISAMDFLKLTGRFCLLADKDGGEVYQHHVGDNTAWGMFKSFVRDRFTGARGLTGSQREFLAQGWSYLYTLNYDDAIDCELGSEYEKVTPFSRFDRNWLMREKKCLIKLHGDATCFLRSGGSEGLIMTSGQYLKAITHESNACLINWLTDDFSSKDLLFVGCSLDDELDLLFANTRGTSSLGADSSQGSYYVLFDKTSSGKLSYEIRAGLESYGIENIIRVKPSEIDELYCRLVGICREAHRVTDEDSLSRFGDYLFCKLSSVSENDNINFLFNNHRLMSVREDGRKVITLPSFVVERDVVDLGLKRLDSGVSVVVLYGRRFSGKTYALLQMLEHLQKQRKRAFFFNSELSDGLVCRLKDERDCVLLFDAGSISGRQARSLVAMGKESMSRRKLQVVLVVNSCDKNFIDDYWKESDGIDDSMAIKIDSKLSDKELTAFNDAVGDLLLVDRNHKDTFLDYAVRVDESQPCCSCSTLPSVNYLTGDRQNMLVCMIALAVCQTISSNEANVLDIHEELVDLSRETRLVVQKEYVNHDESEWYDHSGVRYVSNSLYWVSRCLSEYVVAPSRYAEVAKAMRAITLSKKDQFVGCDKKSPAAFYRRMKPYIYFETLQDIFFVGTRRGGSLTLLEIIYDELGATLKDSYQFLHQYAKCELRVSRRCSNKEKRFEKLSQAIRLLERAIDLAQNRPNNNIKYTLSHMYFTRAIVCTNLVRYCADLVENLPKWINKAIVDYRYVYGEGEGCAKDSCDRDEQKDTAWFVHEVLYDNGNMRELIIACGQEATFDEFATAYTGRKIRINWDNDLGCE